MLTITKEDVGRFSPCEAGTKDLIDNVFQDRESISALDVLNSDKILYEHKLWTVLRAELIEIDKLEKIKGEFLGMIDNPYLKEIAQKSEYHNIIGKVVRCFKQDHEITYKMLCEVVGRTIA